MVDSVYMLSMTKEQLFSTMMLNASAHTRNQTKNTPDKTHTHKPGYAVCSAIVSSRQPHSGQDDESTLRAAHVLRADES